MSGESVETPAFIQELLKDNDVNDLDVDLLTKLGYQDYLPCVDQETPGLKKKVSKEFKIVSS